MEIPYHSSKLFKYLCFYCGEERKLMTSNIEFYQQCTSCRSRTRAKVASDALKKKQKTLRYNLIHLPFYLSASFINILRYLKSLCF